MNKRDKFTEEDLDACWPQYKAYLVEILNEEYSVCDAQNDLLSLIGGRFDDRTPAALKVEAS